MPRPVPPRWARRPVVEPDDEPFLDELYETTRWEEVCRWGLLPETARTFLRAQARTQRRAYALQFPGAEHSVLLRDGWPAGRLIVSREGRDGGAWSIVDVAVLPAFRNQGLATWALGDLLHTAASVRSRDGAEGVVVRLQVEPSNPARRLYERLGFRVSPGLTLAPGTVLMRVPMEWRPAGAGGRSEAVEDRDVSRPRGGLAGDRE